MQERISKREQLKIVLRTSVCVTHHVGLGGEEPLLARATTNLNDESSEIFTVNNVPKPCNLRKFTSRKVRC